MYYTQENIILHSIHAIFDKGIFSKCTDSHAKKYKLYNKLLNKISSETELLMPDPSRKDGPAPVPILHISISLIQNNSLTYSSSLSLSYKFISLSSTLESKKLTVEIKEDDDVDSDVEI